MGRFWHVLLAEQSLLSPKSLAQMQQFREFSTGAIPGSYGLGLMKYDVPYPVRGACTPPQHCACRHGRCTANLTVIGHDGMDWGSTMGLNGYVPQLGASISLAVNALRGMNSSLNSHQNAMLVQTVFIKHCLVLNAIYVAKYPNSLGLDCAQTQALPAATVLNA